MPYLDVPCLSLIWGISRETDSFPARFVDGLSAREPTIYESGVVIRGVVCKPGAMRTGTPKTPETAPTWYPRFIA